ncbi:hypothetical protein SAMN03159507_01064 [Pseudomonas sp. NFACC32-1]|nr:hypothetical protein SAMN03159507_01064 [Pseudomonas sp. NFACC32-1]
MCPMGPHGGLDTSQKACGVLAELSFPVDHFIHGIGRLLKRQAKVCAVTQHVQ